MKFLITGKAGLIGKKLVSFLIRNNNGLRLENVLKWQNDVFLNIKKGTLYREMFNNFFIFFLSFSYR